MNKEKTLKLIDRIEGLFSELKSEILKIKKSDRIKSQKLSLLSLREASGIISNEELLEKAKKVRINFGNYPLIKDSVPVLIKALYVLNVSRQELKVEALTAVQISKIMPFFNKLKKGSRHAITKTLDRHKDLISINFETTKRIFYSINKEGIDYYKNYCNKNHESVEKKKKSK